MPLFGAGGYKAVKASPSASEFRSKHRYRSKAGNLATPMAVDLRKYCSAVEDQGQVGSCTANAVVGVYEYTGNRIFKTKKYTDLSRLFVYYNGRVRGGYADEDCGSVIQYAMESLVQLGACSEKVWPYVPKKVLTKPTASAYKAAKYFKLQPKNIRKVNDDIERWKVALADGYPIVFGLPLFGSFGDCCQKERFGVVPMPEPGETQATVHGLHAMMCVGYSDAEGVCIVRNSWGTEWGVKGYCYIPYNYMFSKTIGAFDAWVLQPKTPIKDFKKTHIKLNIKKKKISKNAVNNNWRGSGPDSRQKYSILNSGKGVPFATNTYSADAYNDFVNEEMEDAPDYEEPMEEYFEIVEEFGVEIDETEDDYEDFEEEEVIVDDDEDDDEDEDEDEDEDDDDEDGDDGDDGGDDNDEESDDEDQGDSDDAEELSELDDGSELDDEESEMEEEIEEEIEAEEDEEIEAEEADEAIDEAEESDEEAVDDEETHESGLDEAEGEDEVEHSEGGDDEEGGGDEEAGESGGDVDEEADEDEANESAGDEEEHSEGADEEDGGDDEAHESGGDFEEEADEGAEEEEEMASEDEPEEEEMVSEEEPEEPEESEEPEEEHVSEPEPEEEEHHSEGGGDEGGGDEEGNEEEE